LYPLQLPLLKDYSKFKKLLRKNSGVIIQELGVGMNSGGSASILSEAEPQDVHSQVLTGNEEIK